MAVVAVAATDPKGHPRNNGDLVIRGGWMTEKKKIHPALLALTASALGLPGISRAQAPEGLQLDYRYSR